MTVTQSLSIVSLLSVSLGLSSQAFAEDAKRLTQELDYDSQLLVLDIDVGQANVIATDEAQVRIEVDVKAAETAWFNFFDSNDVDNIELATSVSDNRIKLGLSDQDDINQSWRVYVPRTANVRLDMGVGQIEVEGMEAGVDIDLGVGSALVKHSHDYKRIELESGVGEVRFDDNTLGVKVIRNLVSQSLTWQASDSYGDSKIDSGLVVNVGVGEVVVSRL